MQMLHQKYIMGTGPIENKGKSHECILKTEKCSQCERGLRVAQWRKMDRSSSKCRLKKEVTVWIFLQDPSLLPYLCPMYINVSMYEFYVYQKTVAFCPG